LRITRQPPRRRIIACLRNRAKNDLFLGCITLPFGWARPAPLSHRGFIA
jgi:hypothetical protein